MSVFAVRPLLPEDISQLVDYWLKATPEYLRSMGADPARLPSEAEWRRTLERVVACRVREATTYYLVWLVDGHPVGFNSLKNIVFGESGDMHLHMWDAQSRGKGYGGRLFCIAALEFFRLFQLRTVVCEPSVSNPAPNRMLQRIGFPLVRTYTGASSEVSMVCELNQYEIVPAIAERYLRSLMDAG
jgi:RimJ/RimL family protein N-acetyltransferase